MQRHSPFGFNLSETPKKSLSSSSFLIPIKEEPDQSCSTTEEEQQILDAQPIEPNGSVLDAEEINSEETISDDSFNEEEEFRHHVREFIQSHGLHTCKALFAIELRKEELKKPSKKQRCK